MKSLIVVIAVTAIFAPPFLVLVGGPVKDRPVMLLVYAASIYAPSLIGTYQMCQVTV